MSTTYVPPSGLTNPVSHVVAGSGKVIVPLRTVTAQPPAPLPQTLIGSTVQTSFSS